MGKKSNKPQISFRQKKCRSQLEKYRKETGLVQDFYQIEQIKDVKILDGERRYFCKWRGFAQEDNTWEPIAHLLTVADEVIKFEEKHVKRIKRMEDDWMSIFHTHKIPIKKDDLKELYKSRGKKMEGDASGQQNKEKKKEENKQEKQQFKIRETKSKKITKDQPQYSNKKKKINKQENQSVEIVQNSISSRTRKRNPEEKKQVQLEAKKQTKSEVKIKILSEDSSSYKEERPQGELPDNSAQNILPRQFEQLELMIPLHYASISQSVKQQVQPVEEPIISIHSEVLEDNNLLKDVEQPKESSEQIPKKNKKLTGQIFNIKNDSCRMDLKDTRKYTYVGRKKSAQKCDNNEEQIKQVKQTKDPKIVEEPIIQQMDENSNECPHKEISAENMPQKKITVEPIKEDSQDEQIHEPKMVEIEEHHPVEKVECIQQKQQGAQVQAYPSPHSVPHHSQDVNQEPPEEFISVKSNTPIKSKHQNEQQQQSYFTPEAQKNNSLAETKPQKNSDSPQQSKCRYHKSRIIFKDSKNHITTKQKRAKQSINQQDQEEDPDFKEKQLDYISSGRILSQFVSQQQYNLSKPILHSILSVHRFSDCFVFAVEINKDQKLDQRYMSYDMLRDHYPQQLLSYLEETDRILF